MHLNMQPNGCLSSREIKEKRRETMGGVRGRDVILKIGNGGEPESFAVVAGVRARTITLSAGLVDATTAESSGAWRELIAGGGTKRVEVSGSGVFKDAASDARMRAAFFSGETPRLQLEVGGFGVLTGSFAIVELAYSGEHNGEAMFSVRLASAGAVLFEA
jgi:TP901-1 family phage major tail protein